MEIENILKMIDAGFTRDEILQMSTTEEAEAEAKAIAEAGQKADTGNKKDFLYVDTDNVTDDKYQKLKESIDELRKTIIATNQLRNLGTDKPPVTVEDIGEYMINGRKK